MKISASIYSGDTDHLSKLIRQLDEHHIDSFHIDCLDNPEVFDDIEQIRQISDTPIDLHLITEHPEQYYAQIDRLEIEYVTFQYENLKQTLNPPSDWNAEVGLAIVSDTPISVFDDFKTTCDFVLMMTTVPGKSGGTFQKENFKKIRKFKARYPGIEVHVDGGVNEEVSFILRNMGIDQVVSGSYLVNHDSLGTAMLNLKAKETESHYRVRDFMVDQEETPLLKLNGQLSFEDVIDSIEQYEMGLTLVTDEQNKLEGIITNADMRRGLKKFIRDLNKVEVAQMINRNPVVIREDATVKEMIQLIKKKNFPILYLPVVDEQNKAVGIVTFNNLIKGEL